VLKAVLLVLATLLASPALATSITLPYIFVPNTTIVSAQVNANFSIIAGVVNGNVDNSNLSAGANISLSKLNATQSFLDLQAASGTLGIGVGQTGDSVPRVGLYSDGSIQFGPGTATATDVGIKRSGAITLQLYSPSSAGTPIFDLGGGSLETNGSPAYMINGGRLYLVSGSPLADGSSSGNATIYFGPAYSTFGNLITLYSGTAEATQTFAETSLSISALATGVYDVFVSSASSSTITLSTSAWSGLNTIPTRGVQDGRLTKNGTATALLVGSIYVYNPSSGVTYDWLGGRDVSNVYNALPKTFFASITTASWTPGSLGSTNSNVTDGQGRVSFVTAIAGQNCIVTYCANVYGSWANNGSWSGTSGIGINSTSVAAVLAGITGSASGAASGVSVNGGSQGSVVNSYSTSTAVGYNYLQKLMSGSAATAIGSGTLDVMTGFIDN
jgi:hypothetical protein